MNNYTLENFMKLVTNDKEKKGKESRTDEYYRQVYEKIHIQGKKINWNWGALSCGYWFLFRKMYSAALLYLTFILLISITGESPLVLLAALPVMLFTGLFGNWLYVRHIFKKIDKGYHLGNRRNIDSISPWLIFLGEVLSRGSYLLSLALYSIALIFVIITIIFDKKKTKAALSSINLESNETLV